MNLSGLCLCGCGQKTNIAPQTRSAIGWKKGFPINYMPGHSAIKKTPLYEIDPSTGCWIWQRHITKCGYGLGYSKGKTVNAHRFIYEKIKGPIPKGLTLDHLCRLPRCVNPDHLEPVTHKENNLRGNTISGINARKTHCRNGHPFNEENTYKHSRGRNCRTCKKATDVKCRPKRELKKKLQRLNLKIETMKQKQVELTNQLAKSANP